MAKSMQSDTIGKLNRNGYRFASAATNNRSKISITFVCESADSIDRLLPFLTGYLRRRFQKNCD